MVIISKTVQQNLSNIDNVLTSNEQEMVRPFFLQKYIQEGLMIAIRSFMKKNPDMEIKQVADLFDVDIELVEQSKLLS